MDSIFENPDLLFGLFIAFMLFLLKLNYRSTALPHPGNERRTFVNGLISSPYFLRFTFIFLFVLLPAALLFLEARLLVEDLGMALVFSVMMGVIMAVLLVLFIFLRKYFIFEVTTDANGISATGLLRRVEAPWHEVRVSGPPGEVVTLFRVETRDEAFYFPLTMVELGARWPRPRVGMLGCKWINEDGSRSNCTPENSPLFQEIRKHLGMDP